MHDQLVFVQFMHPGGEHKPDQGNLRTWNTGDHKRKFMVSEASYLEAGTLRQGNVLFWGEWEAESEAVSRFAKPSGNLPEFVYRPFWRKPVSYNGIQNTDPFVFGHAISYSCCKQFTKVGPTYLRHLSRGSVVLFGSHKAGQFVLDTVLVVDSWVEHDRERFWSDVADKLHPTYRDVTFAPIYGPKSTCGNQDEGSALIGASYRLYSGATVENPVNGMFSFFPCMKAEFDSGGFSRPSIRMAEVTDALKMGGRKNIVENTDDIRLLWDKVREQVESAGLLLGFAASMPPER